MSRPLPPLNALRAFEAAARLGGFVAAAAELHVTPAAISHHVKALEERLGLPLFARRARGLALTSDGAALLPDLRDAFDRIAQAIERLDRNGGGRVLTVSLVTTFALAWLVPRLHRFQTAHPDIEVRITTSQRRVDFEREDVDCAIRFTALPPASLHATKLFDDVLTPLSGRRYAARLKKPSDLRGVPLIDTSFEPEWPIWLRAMGLDAFEPQRTISFDSTKIGVEAAIEGAGVAIGPPDLFRDDLREGRLVQPFPDIVASGKAWWFVTAPAPASAERPKIKAFRAWLLDELARDRKGKVKPAGSGASARAGSASPA